MIHGTEHTGADGRAPVVPCPDILRVEVSESRPGVLVLSPVGEVDGASADVLRRAARDAVAATPRCLVVDLGRLTFCGSTGLVVLMDTRRDAEAAGVRFGTADGPPIVRRVLEITQLGPVLRHRETLDAALQELDA
ncbi:SpoIIAA-like anti-anti-sigma regulatory factor [Pseudonocardia hierapolitana]|uniref:Anti-sigma factor antagonist n=1 Tax=Pseudonocardia hierapolitana TaxID=1128676 RepID=A0A561T2K5_9PSEU|nr:STAS domain-containing protein [Pseudonocardia hierapolitana]TWF81341.1 SpoIIAA-like anti-anti-sigma regulatory factor [Pseudonocardia hierapolitana]